MSSTVAMASAIAVVPVSTVAASTVFANCATLKRKPVVIDWHVGERRAALVWIPKHPLQAGNKLVRTWCTRSSTGH